MERWTKEKIKTLKKVFKNRPNRLVAQYCGKSPAAVRQMAHRLGLKKTKKYLRENLGRK